MTIDPDELRNVLGGRRARTAQRSEPAAPRPKPSPAASEKKQNTAPVAPPPVVDDADAQWLFVPGQTSLDAPEPEDARSAPDVVAPSFASLDSEDVTAKVPESEPPTPAAGAIEFPPLPMTPEGVAGPSRVIEEPVSQDAAASLDTAMFAPIPSVSEAVRTASPAPETTTEIPLVDSGTSGVEDEVPVVEAAPEIALEVPLDVPIDTPTAMSADAPPESLPDRSAEETDATPPGVDAAPPLPLPAPELPMLDIAAPATVPTLEPAPRAKELDLSVMADVLIADAPYREAPSLATAEGVGREDGANEESPVTGLGESPANVARRRRALPRVAMQVRLPRIALPTVSPETKRVVLMAFAVLVAGVFIAWALLTPPSYWAHFTIRAASAKTVTVIGDFNGWDSTATPMTRRGKSSLWDAWVKLPPGEYEYLFIQDGRIQRTDADMAEIVMSGKDVSLARSAIVVPDDPKSAPVVKTTWQKPAPAK